MVGLVLVSHSAELAAATKALADQQTQGKAAIAAVGGTGDPEVPYGTDAMAILEAIQAVYDDDGVLVLMDLGSAIMSAETALEFMDPDQAARVRLSAGPFVEGAMAAAVQASIGMGLAAVAAEAFDAMRPKAESLQEPAQPAPPLAPHAAGVAEATGQATGRATLVNHAGLHFGPAVLFVQSAAGYQALIQVTNLSTGSGPADAKRFNQVLGLGAEQGHEIELRAEGPDAQAAIGALLALARAGFGEAETAPEMVAAIPAAPVIEARGRLVLEGIPASPGVALGTAYQLATAAPSVPCRQVDDPASERARYITAVAQAQSDLSALAERMARELGPEQSRIFQAHALLLQDPDLESAVRAAIEGQAGPFAINAEAAVDQVFEAEAQRYAAMAGERFQERAADLRDVRTRLLRLLQGEDREVPSLPEAAVVVAEDLAPSQTAALDRDRVVAFCTGLGGPTSHSAILARSMGIPAVVGLGLDGLAQLPGGTVLAVDGTAGTVTVEPDDATIAAYREQQQAEAVARQEARQAAQAAARTRDGQRVEVVANLATATEAAAALQAGAEGVGLLRTEFLFQDRTEPPGEEEQLAVYRQVAQTMAPRPVIIRTLDIGGDKPAPYLHLPAEANPFLGWRAIRISLAMPEFFKTQLRAILRAAVDGNVKVMFPMVATIGEVEGAHMLLVEAREELQQAGIPCANDLSTGIMIEVPAAVAIADKLAPLVDFFSIGTNDLTQYTFAVDRGNARVANLGDPMHPAVLRQIARVIDAAHAAGKWTGLCGELAGRPEAIPILLGLGLDEFSMSAASIPEAKATLTQLTVPECQQLARHVLDLPDGASVRAAVREATPSG
jgi:phosphocarrier protein FPr